MPVASAAAGPQLGPSADVRYATDPHWHRLVGKTDVIVLRSHLFVPNRHLSTGGELEKWRHNHVSISGSFRKLALLCDLGFGIEWVQGRTSSSCPECPGPALGRSCPVGPLSRPLSAEDRFWVEVPFFSPGSTTGGP